MKLHFQYEVKATLWPPCNTSHLPLPHGTRSFTIPAYSVIEITSAGLAYDGQIIADMPKGWRLHVDKNHHGNVNFFNEVYSSRYKTFDPIEATNEPNQD